MSQVDDDEQDNDDAADTDDVNNDDGYDADDNCCLYIYKNSRCC